MILLIDNYDSFVHNLARYLRRLGHETRVVRNDAIDSAGVRDLAPAAVVLSPGPCTPTEAGNSLAIVRDVLDETPMLGVCLGHQTIAAALGGRIVRSPAPMHGRASVIEHDQSKLFNGIPSPMQVGRYHSLIVDELTLPAELKVTARASDGAIMAFEHRDRPIFGVQFHPESILTEHGYPLLANFLAAAGLPVEPYSANLDTERPVPPPAAPPPSLPITF